MIVPCVNSAVCSRSLSITVKNQMCGLPLALVDGPLWIRERRDVAACIIPFMIRLLLRRIKVQHIAASMSLRRDSSCTHGSRLCSSASVQLVLGDHLQKMFKLDVPPQTGPFIEKEGTLWIGTCNWGLSVRIMCTWEISSLHHVFIHVCDRSFVSNRECATLLRLGLAYFEKHAGECLTSQVQTTRIRVVKRLERV